MDKRRETQEGARPPFLRRKVIMGTASGAVPLVFGGLSVFATRVENVRCIGFTRPHSGSLTAIGARDPYVPTLVLKAHATGINIGQTSYRTQILDRAPQPSPSRAGQLTKDPISNLTVDLIPSTSIHERINPLADTCEAAGLSSLFTADISESFSFGRSRQPDNLSPFNGSNAFHFGTGKVAKPNLSAWNQVPANKLVGFMTSYDADGNAVRTPLARSLEKTGYTFVDPSPDPDETLDYRAQIAFFRRGHCQIFTLVAPPPPDSASVWRQGLAQRAQVVMPATACMLPTSVGSYGQIAYNTVPRTFRYQVFAYKSAPTEMSRTQLANCDEVSTGRKWVQQVCASMALFETGTAALRNPGAPGDKKSVREVLATLDVVTLLGQVNFDTRPTPNVSDNTSMIGYPSLKALVGSKCAFSFDTLEKAARQNMPVQSLMKPCHL